VKRDLDKTLSQADAYEKAQEQIGDLAAQLHDRDLTIKRLENELEAAEELREPIKNTYACQRCGRRDGLDAVVPNDIWDKLEAETGCQILCLWCIDALCRELKIKTSCSLHFCGLAICGTSQSDADRDHINRLCLRAEAAEGRAKELEQHLEAVKKLLEAAEIKLSDMCYKAKLRRQEMMREGHENTFAQSQYYETLRMATDIVAEILTVTAIITAEATLSHPRPAILDRLERLERENERLQKIFNTLIINAVEKYVEACPGTVTLNTRFEEDLDLDHLDIVEIVVDIEGRLGIVISDEKFEDVRMVGDLVNGIEKCLQALEGGGSK
jgi:acyl carrier protein